MTLESLKSILVTKTVFELRAIAKSQKISRYSKLRKQELIELLIQECGEELLKELINFDVSSIYSESDSININSTPKNERITATPPDIVPENKRKRKKSFVIISFLALLVSLYLDVPRILVDIWSNSTNPLARKEIKISPTHVTFYDNSRIYFDVYNSSEHFVYNVKIKLTLQDAKINVDSLAVLLANEIENIGLRRTGKFILSPQIMLYTGYDYSWKKIIYISINRIAPLKNYTFEIFENHVHDKKVEEFNIQFELKSFDLEPSQHKQNPDLSRAEISFETPEGMYITGIYNLIAKKNNFELLQESPNDPVAHFNHAHDLRREGNFIDAIKHFQIAITLNPGYFQAHNDLGSILFFELNDIESAKTHFKLALDANPNFAMANNNYGLILYKEGYIDEAFNHYKEAIKIDPNCAEAYCNLGNYYKDNLEFKKAEYYFLKGLELDSGLLGGYKSYGDFLASTNRYSEALENYKKILEFRQDYYIQIKIAEIYSRNLNNTTAAKSHLEFACQLESDKYEAYLLLGELYTFSEEYDKAYKILQIAERVGGNDVWTKPELVMLNSCLGKIESVKNNYIEAELYYQKTLRLDSTNLNAHKDLVEIYIYKMKKMDAAYFHLNRIISIDPHDWLAFFELATIYTDHNKFNEAERCYSKSISNGGSSIVHNSYGELLFKMNKYQEAKNQFELAIKKDEKYAIGHCNYAGMLSKFGELNEAKKHYDIAINLSADEPIILMLYAYFLKNKINDVDMARTYYVRACKLEPKFKSKENDSSFIISY